MPQIRKCADCGEPSLTPVARELQIYNSVIHYKCDNCGNELELTPLASIGVLMTVGVLVLAFWAYILFSDIAPPGPIALSLFGLAILALGYVTVVPLLAHILNPAITSDAVADVDITGADKHAAKRVILWVEGLGLLAGLLAPVLLIAGVLAVSAAIGYINFTYFGN